MNATEFCHRAGLNGLETKIIEAICAKDYDAARISIEMLEALNVGPTRKSWIAANRLSSACFTLAHGSRVPLKTLAEALKLDAKAGPGRRVHHPLSQHAGEWRTYRSNRACSQLKSKPGLSKWLVAVAA